VDSNLSSGRVYSLDRRSLPNGLPPPGRAAAVRLHRGASFVVILLLSLGLWAAIWAAIASLPSFVLR
jgi:hypothetical protein